MDERSKHSPIFTSFQKNITEKLFEYLNTNIKFKLTTNHDEYKVLLGSHIIKDILSGSVIGRGANGIAIQFDNNIVIKVVKMMDTNRDIIENEVVNMIELYKRNGEYNFRNDDLIKLLGVVYIDSENNLVQNFDKSRTSTTEFFIHSIDGITPNDRIGFVVMEKYEGDLTSLSQIIRNSSGLLKYDIAKQMIVQLNDFFKKGYYHSDLHDGNWFYKKEGEKYIVKIADYGSEIKADEQKIGVHRLSPNSESQDNEKKNSLMNLMLALANCSIITYDEYFSFLDYTNYPNVLNDLIDLLKRKYHPINYINNYFDLDNNYFDLDEINGILLSLKTM